ncbi:MAG: nucleotide exchange factor GrpE [Acidobacteriota bacterium]
MTGRSDRFTSKHQPASDDAGELDMTSGELPPIKHDDIEISFEDTGIMRREAAQLALTREPEPPKEAPPHPPQPAPIKLEDTPEYQKLLQEKAVLADQLLRKMADFDNFRKRLDREKAEFMVYANTDLVLDLLPFLDNLERALSHTNHDNMKGFVEGVELIYRQVKEVLAKYGVTPIEALGTPFDPTYHQAIGFAETSTVQDGHVAEEVLKGYMIHERLLRPACVRVARAPEPPAETAPAAETES